MISQDDEKTLKERVLMLPMEVRVLNKLACLIPALRILQPSTGHHRFENVISGMQLQETTGP